MASEEGRKPSIPKFGSFKPKSEDATKNDQGLKVEEGSERKHERTHHHHQTIQKRARRFGEAPVDRRPEGSVFQVPRRQAHVESAREASFFVDKRGDPLITQYGGNNRYDVPKYRRFGSSRILGADGFLRMEQSGSRDVFSIRGHNEGGSLLKGDRMSVLARSKRTKARPVRLRKYGEPSSKITQEFLPLRQSRKRRRNSARSAGSSGEDGPAYRSITGKSKPHEHSDSDEIFDSDSSENATGQERSRDPAVLRSSELSARVKEHPDDIDAWLELVDLQDTILRISQEEDHQMTQAEAKGYADIKLSILEKALAQAQSTQQRETLLLRVMGEGAKVWDPKTLTKRWEELMKEHGSSFEIWLAYVSFRQTTLSTFRYEEVKQLYVSRFRRIRSEIAKATAQTPVPAALYEEFVVLLFRTTRFMSNSGFAELAAATWQATLELNFCRPPSLLLSDEEITTSAFQTFWESEVPRAGEDSAKGWASFETSGGTEEAPEPRLQDATVQTSTRDPFKAWAALEQRGVETSATPARTMDAGTEEDPYRVVMFGDVEDFLIPLPSEDLSKVQHHLIDAFLAFHQSLPAGRYPEDGSSSDPYGLLDVSNNYHFTVGESIKGDDTGNETRLFPDFGHDNQRMTRSMQELFPSPAWFKYLNPRKGPEAFSMMANTAKLLALNYEQRELGPQYLAFEGSRGHSSIKKVAKVLLKQYPSNVDLYIGYACLDSATGDHTSARNIVSAALGLSELSAENKLRLCITWAWIELEAGSDLDNVASRLDIAAGGSPDTAGTTPAQYLKTRRLFSSSRDYSLSAGALDGAITWATGLALLEYLNGQSGKEPQGKGQGDIATAMQSVTDVSDEMAQRGLSTQPEHEVLLQFAARLLYFHATRGPFRPAFLREHLAKYIAFFPQNTIFLDLYAWRETRLGVDDRVRSVLARHVLTAPHDCISSRIFAIRHEAARGNVHSTRAAFEHAVASEVGRHHAGLWIWYIRFCHARRDELSSSSSSSRSNKTERAKVAREVFYRAVQACPFSKGVFMEAFVTLIDEMDSGELKSVYGTLCEKGLRVHVEMEEFVEGWKKRARERRGG